AHEIVGIGRDVGRLHAALKDGTLDRVTTAIGDGVKDADLIVLGTPVGIIEHQLPEVWQAAAPSAVITDVGSTKAAIVAAAQRLEPAAFDVAARGFKDTTRIAAGDVDMWEAIFLANRTAVVQAAAAAQAALADLVRLIERKDRDGLRAALARIKARRERLP